MPYKLANKTRLPPLTDLTDLQKKALEYLWEHRSEDRWIDAREVALAYGYANGWWFRGVLASLEKRSLIVKREEN
jgi:hypothetical protein